ncbi:unnamed protein product [Chondrus crispus]|uniref:R3H domain-containing protein n=1 Tax=Chondrus crispus TaxID=2769 RepID=R7QSE9_CHOCR|nr:unnamed protein product [Chondrus crispus]CDF40315.1 unnamed protein product [Chondrus crispus]|eukprot:XP_005710609.1 unnamed protein product [Chondrus crispus]
MMNSLTDDVHPFANREKLPSNAPRTGLRPPPMPARQYGIDLKHAEQITRRLLLAPTTLPTYTALPSVPNLSPAQHRFLYEDGFASLPPSLDPASRGKQKKGKDAYGVPHARASKKRFQVANLVAAVCALIPTPDASNSKSRRRKGMPRLLDLCGGCGHVGLPLAALFPHCRVIVVDTNQIALGIAARRAAEAGLSNLDTLERNIEQLQGVPFDVAVALHACGGASDTVLAAAAGAGAAVVVAPCCVGGVVAKKGSVTGRASGAVVRDPASAEGAAIDWDVARSSLFRGLLAEAEYPRLARAADFGEQLLERDGWRRVAKSLVEQDRALWMGEMGYGVRVVKMRPLDCTPKNDMLVAWPRKTLGEEDSGFGSDVGWDLDIDANMFLADVRDENVMKGLGMAEVAEVESILREQVFSEDSTGLHHFPMGLGKRKRKVIHAVAESMGLWHGSIGKGAQRYVSVRRTASWPLFFDYFLGIGGPEIERVCASLVEKIPPACAERRVHMRGNPHHITIIRPPEISHLSNYYKHGKQRLLSKAFESLKHSTMQILGVGRVRGPTKRTKRKSSALPESTVAKGVVVEPALAEAYFVVVEWPAGNALRTELGLPPIDFHITLGFSVKDIHDVRKDRSTLVFNHEANLPLRPF